MELGHYSSNQFNKLLKGDLALIIKNMHPLFYLVTKDSTSIIYRPMLLSTQWIIESVNGLAESFPLSKRQFKRHFLCESLVL